LNKSHPDMCCIPGKDMLFRCILFLIQVYTFEIYVKFCVFWLVNWNENFCFCIFANKDYELLRNNNEHCLWKHLRKRKFSQKLAKTNMFCENENFHKTKFRENVLIFVFREYEKKVFVKMKKKVFVSTLLYFWYPYCEKSFGPLQSAWPRKAWPFL
jgi:hypothetical protein